MNNKERMLHMVLDDPKLQELYDYDKSEYEDLYQALNSENVIVAAVARNHQTPRWFNRREQSEKSIYDSV